MLNVDIEYKLNNLTGQWTDKDGIENEVGEKENRCFLDVAL